MNVEKYLGIKGILKFKKQKMVLSNIKDNKFPSGKKNSNFHRVINYVKGGRYVIKYFKGKVSDAQT